MKYVYLKKHVLIINTFVQVLFILEFFKLLTTLVEALSTINLTKPF